MPSSRLTLTREQILAFRRRAGSLDQRLPMSADSLRQAAWAGLQDSMPRAALLSIHARVAGTTPETIYDYALVQLWGPRYSAYVVAKEDVAPFTLGRMPDDERGRKRARDAAERLRELLGESRRRYGDAGLALDVVPNSLRYGATTGSVLMRWEGARQPVIWMVPPPNVDTADAQLELGRRYLHVFGPSTANAFANWAGISDRAAARTFETLAPDLTPVRTPIGHAWMLTADESDVRSPIPAPAPVRLLPSGDTYFLLQGSERELLAPDENRRSQLWTPRVWPGALLVRGEIAGIWRRADAKMDIETWQRLSPQERQAVEVEATSLPLPGLKKALEVRWLLG